MPWRFTEVSWAPPDWVDRNHTKDRHQTQVHPQKEEDMRKILMAVTLGTVTLMAGSSAKAQVDLSAYADSEGFLDVQALTCAQLAGTWQGQADLLTAWYSGWYNGLAKKHYMDISKGREAEHEVIVYCKANPEIKVIQAMDIVFKSMRERMGIKVQ
jgi:HdeA/HdeB family